jgi:hypothetical protein
MPRSGKLALETLIVAPDSSDRQSLLGALKRELAIVIFQAALNFELSPFCSVTLTMDGRVELAGPQQWYSIKTLASTEQISRRCAYQKPYPG